ncbi:MAG: hypothetical protein NTW19_10135 [Planctomycetota bacterium]|nr:hypothetical protein [Planctomycetota bacterium]
MTQDPAAPIHPPTYTPAHSPLRTLQESQGATFIPYGPADAAVELVDTFGEYQAEYAAIRKGVGILETPHLGVVEAKGADRLEFLHRMLTNDTRTLTPGQARRAFLLGKTGRIIADAIVLQLEGRTLLDLDIFQARTLPADLEKYLFTEDVQLADATSRFGQLGLHGPAAVALLEAAGATGLAGLEPLRGREITCAGAACVVYRRDVTAALGLQLLVPREAFVAVYTKLAELVSGLRPQVEGGVIRSIRGRGIGWLAFNTARIEAGSPLFHVDFGPDSLPHETGLIHETVSFTKGCYLGQEVVARMQNLGHPKKLLVGLKFDDDRMPIAGTGVMEPPEPATPAATDGASTTATAAATPTPAPSGSTSGRVIGAVTSSTLSPLLGGKAVAFAMMKWGLHKADTKVVVPAEGQMVPAKVQALTFVTGATPA